MEELQWRDERRRLGDLLPQPDNPRQIKEHSGQLLVESREEFGQPLPLIIGPDDEIYNGHQRLQVWMQEYGADFEVAVRVASRPLSHAEWQKMTVLLHKGAAGEWDFDGLASWGIEESLLEWGFEDWELGGFSGEDDVPSLDDLEEEYGETEERDFWPKIEVIVAPETLELWLSLVDLTGVEDEALAAERVLMAVDTTALESGAA